MRNLIIPIPILLKELIPEEAAHLFELRCMDNCYSKWFNLKGTGYFYYRLNDAWLYCTEECECPHTSKHCKGTNFEEVLDNVPDELRDELLFHLDLFA